MAACWFYWPKVGGSIPPSATKKRNNRKGWFLSYKGGGKIAKGKYREWLEPDKLRLLEGWARDGLTDKQIAHNIGINVATLYRWKNESNDICNSLKKGKEVVDIEVENALLKSALSGNVTAQIFWLKNRRPDKWREKQEVKVNTEVEDLSCLADMIK